MYRPERSRVRSSFSRCRCQRRALSAAKFAGVNGVLCLPEVAVLGPLLFMMSISKKKKIHFNQSFDIRRDSNHVSVNTSTSKSTYDFELNEKRSGLMKNRPNN